VAPGASKFNVGAGNNNRLVFSGAEDLGGGLAATFAVQARFNPATGTQEQGSVGAVTSVSAGTTLIPGAKDLNGNYLNSTGTAAGNGSQTVNFGRPLFQGETTVGLRGAFGQVRIGRALSALQLPNGGYLDPWGVTTVASSVYAAGFATDYAAGGEGRIDGAVFYNSPNISGFGLGLSYSPKKVAIGGASTADVLNGAVYASSGNAADFSKRHVSLALTYANGPVAAVVGVEKNRFGDSLLNVGGNYDAGFAKLYAGYGVVKGGTKAARDNVTFTAVAVGAPGGGLTPVAADGKINELSFGANIPYGAATIRLGYNRYDTGAGTFAGQTRYDGVLGVKGKDSKLGLGVNYALSKRTSIYSDVASISRKFNAAGVNPASNNDKVTAFDFGIAHAF
jgi:predicted porin